TFPFFISGF
ncbi:unnamed protein product, partial [Callosobruchus maculatus]